MFSDSYQKKVLLTPHLQLFLEIPFSRISRGENCQQNWQRIHFFKEEGTRKLCYFSPRNFCWCGFKVLKKIFQKTLFTLFYSSFSGWSCCIIYCLSHLENRSWFVWGYYSNNANKCTWNQYYRFTQPLFHSSRGDWWSKNLNKKEWIPF